MTKHELAGQTAVVEKKREGGGSLEVPEQGQEGKEQLTIQEMVSEMDRKLKEATRNLEAVSQKASPEGVLGKLAGLFRGKKAREEAMKRVGDLQSEIAVLTQRKEELSRDAGLVREVFSSDMQSDNRVKNAWTIDEMHRVDELSSKLRESPRALEEAKKILEKGGEENFEMGEDLKVSISDAADAFDFVYVDSSSRSTNRKEDLLRKYGQAVSDETGAEKVLDIGKVPDTEFDSMIGTIVRDMDKQLDYFTGSEKYLKLTSPDKRERVETASKIRAVLTSVLETMQKQNERMRLVERSRSIDSVVLAQMPGDKEEREKQERLILEGKVAKPTGYDQKYAVDSMKDRTQNVLGLCQRLDNFIEKNKT
ncbi:MAG: hypothetical protein HYV41_02090 [Candidatus Magasanikbacteria bacterium]|nr:hypothetical protein [Candidatus Magasanikbacteria bacterium]